MMFYKTDTGRVFVNASEENVRAYMNELTEKHLAQAKTLITKTSAIASVLHVYRKDDVSDRALASIIAKELKEAAPPAAGNLSKAATLLTQAAVHLKTRANLLHHKMEMQSEEEFLFVVASVLEAVSILLAPEADAHD